MPKKNKFIPRTNKQNSAFHELLGKFKIDDAMKAEIVKEATNGRETSSSKMSFDEMNWAIEIKLGGTAFASRTKRKTTWYPKNVVGMISPQAKDKITEIRNMRPQLASPEAWQRFCQRMLHKSEPRTVTDGQKVIEALKAMNKRDAENTPVAETKEAA